MLERVDSKNWKMGFGLALLSMGCGITWSQTTNTWTYPGCADVTDASFSYTTLVQYKNNKLPDPGLIEPSDLDFDTTNGAIDIYYSEIRPGMIKRYNGATKTVDTLATLPVWHGPYESVPDGTASNGTPVVEEGVTGIVLDPNFNTNHWIYVHWSPASASVFRISRFTVSGNTIPLSSEKIILQFPSQRDECCHTGGSMEFDDYGDLWISQGANGGRGTDVPPTEGMNNTTLGVTSGLPYESEEWGASNTHGLRGGILRIHPLDFSDAQTPTAGVNSTYSIPPGNFGEYFAQQLNDTSYLDTSKVRPEVFTKGSRNPYKLSIDPVRRWVLWGDVGPDGSNPPPSVREELDLRKTPGFMGWPYFVGNNTVFSYPIGGSAENPAAPVNTSKWNTGLLTLPPAQPAIVVGPDGGGGCPIGGPLYRYDGALNSAVKFPPHFNRMWFSADHDSYQVWVNAPDSAGNTVTSQKRIFQNQYFDGPVALKFGPDGALYLIGYGVSDFSVDTGTCIMKISYTGTCHPATPILEQPVGIYLNPAEHYVTQPTGFVVNLGANSPILVPNDMVGFELFDLMGRKIWEAKNLRPGSTFTLPAGLERGALKFRWVSAIQQ